MALDKAVSNLTREMLQAGPVGLDNLFVIALRARQEEYQKVQDAIRKSEFRGLKNSEESRRAHWAVVHRTGLPPEPGRVCQPGGGRGR